MAAPTVSGTFSATGQSGALNAKYIRIALDFAGAATVGLEVQGHDGNWVADSEYQYTADRVVTYYNLAEDNVRLNCTAHTNDVVYSMVPVQGRLGIGG